MHYYGEAEFHSIRTVLLYLYIMYTRRILFNVTVVWSSAQGNRILYRCCSRRDLTRFHRNYCRCGKWRSIIIKRVLPSDGLPPLGECEFSAGSAKYHSAQSADRTQIRLSAWKPNPIYTYNIIYTIVYARRLPKVYTPCAVINVLKSTVRLGGYLGRRTRGGRSDDDITRLMNTSRYTIYTDTMCSIIHYYMVYARARWVSRAFFRVPVILYYICIIIKYIMPHRNL